MNEPLVIGIDLGGTKILAGAVDREGKIVRREERTTPTGSQEELLQAIDGAAEGVGGNDVIALGLGIPSTIDQRTGRVVSSVNIPLADLPIRDRMVERFGYPTGIDNDANAAAIAEWMAGAGRGSSTMIMLTLGTGVGGGIILDGRPYRGPIGTAGELGHIVIEHDGPPCQGTCTGRGHLEALVSGTAASRVAAELYGPGADAHLLVAKARDGDERGITALREIGRKLGSGIGTLVNIFGPELVVIGGGFGAAGDLLLDPAREVVHREALAPDRDTVRVVSAELGAEAGVIGAAFVGFEAFDAAWRG
jgi:glucokinase